MNVAFAAMQIAAAMLASFGVTIFVLAIFAKWTRKTRHRKAARININQRRRPF